MQSSRGPAAGRAARTWRMCRSSGPSRGASGTLSSRASRAGLLLAAGYLVAALHGLGASDIVGDDEAREAGIVQDVVAGHWLWPRFNGEPLPAKPVLYHWLPAPPRVAPGVS